jgi:ribosomal protein S18 acetylase RimI-like enzyme
MKTNINRTTFNKVDQDEYKSIWKSSFTEDDVSKAFPYPLDDVLTVTVDDKIVGFCMIHSKPPYDFTKAPINENYLYNLCILPEYRRNGYATQLINTCKKEYNTLLTHLAVSGENLQWFARRGFGVLDTWRGVYIEHVYPPTELAKQEAEVPEISEYYDYVENLMYLQPSKII